MNSLIAKVTATTVGTLFLGLLSVNPASAFGVTTYQLDDYTVFANTTDPGLLINTQELLTQPTSFTLNEGQSVTYDLFRIWTNETTVNPDDTVAKNISVAYNFSLPSSLGNNNASGTTVGTTTFLGVTQSGQLNWNPNPIVLSYGNNGQLTISLSNVSFNQGLFGLNPGFNNGAIVRATFTHVSTETPVPEPLTVLGSVIALGFGTYTKKKLYKNGKAAIKQRQTV